MRKTKSWTARPTSKMLFPVVGSLPLDSDELIRAAPATCRTVQTASEATKSPVSPSFESGYTVPQLV